MEQIKVLSYNQIVEESIQKYWNRDSMSDYGLFTFKYKDVAEIIEKFHILYSELGIQKGDKIALCGRNLSRWGAAFFSIITYGAVAVPILHEFHPSQVHDIVNHSEARLLLVGDKVWPALTASEMPNLEGIISLADYGLLCANTDRFAQAFAAVDQNYAPAQNFLGRMYLHGRGVEQSYQEALNWCRMSANQGYVNAQRMLGDLFLKGKGDDIPQDYLKAASWYRKAAEKGDAESQYKYGNMYYHGHGVDQDYVEAIIWFRKSAEQNNPDALVSLGYMYTKGIGVTKNLAEAAKYYGLAMNVYQGKAEQGDKNAQKRLAKLKEKM